MPLDKELLSLVNVWHLLVFAAVFGVVWRFYLKPWKDAQESETRRRHDIEIRLAAVESSQKSMGDRISERVHKNDLESVRELMAAHNSKCDDQHKEVTELIREMSVDIKELNNRVAKMEGKIG